MTCFTSAGGLSITETEKQFYSDEYKIYINIKEILYNSKIKERNYKRKLIEKEPCSYIVT